MIDAHNLQGGIGLGRGDTPRRKTAFFLGFPWIMVIPSPIYWDTMGIVTYQPTWLFEHKMPSKKSALGGADGLAVLFCQHAGLNGKKWNASALTGSKLRIKTGNSLKMVEANEFYTIVL
jgi:hypothetical protein